MSVDTEMDHLYLIETKIGVLRENLLVILYLKSFINK